MIYLQQPEKSKLCGQTCLAMVAEKSIEDIITLTGTDKGTTTQQILATLTKLHMSHAGRLIPRRKQELPDLAICKVRREWNKSGNWHWVVLSNGYVYDPDPITIGKTYDVTHLAEYDEMNETRKQKITSFIAIHKES